MKSYYTPIKYTVSAEEDGWVLNTILHRKMKLSRRLITRLKQVTNGLMVNGEQRYTNSHVISGDQVEIRMPVEESEDILPQPIPFEIVYEDEALLIVNKASGMIVHPTHGHYTNTLANGIVHYWRERGEKFRFRPIHRLDQDTTGVIAIAKNPYVHQHVSEQLKANECYKEYYAVVHGVLQSEQGTIEAAMDRSDIDPHIRTVRVDGFPATTHYKVIRRFPHATAVRLWLETGRTHQIRVHMLHIGHPLIGDPMYRKTPLNDLPMYSEAPHDLGMTRQALHAICLGFKHPVTHQDVRFSAELPEDIAHLLKRLEAGG